MENIILTGFMGCGKSTVGIRLSYKLRQIVEDTDKLIEKEQGKSISEIFAEEGEAFFRELETKCLQKLMEDPSKRIISVGGGLPMKEENRRLLSSMGKVIYLRVSPQEVYERLKNDTTRPLLQGDNPLQKIALLMEQRAPFYEEGADIIIKADNKDMEEVIMEILDAVLDGEEYAMEE